MSQASWLKPQAHEPAKSGRSRNAPARDQGTHLRTRDADRGSTIAGLRRFLLNRSEALALSDRIAVMHQSRIVQVGTPHEIYYQPRNLFVAGFVGRSNVLAGKLLEGATEGGVLIETALGPVLCMAPGIANAAEDAVLIRPEHVVLTPSRSAGDRLNRFQGRVTQTAFFGEAVECIVEVNGVNLLVRNTVGRHDGSAPVDVYFPPAWALAIACDG